MSDKMPRTDSSQAMQSLTAYGIEGDDDEDSDDNNSPDFRISGSEDEGTGGDPGSPISDTAKPQPIDTAPAMDMDTDNLKREFDAANSSDGLVKKTKLTKKG